MNRSLQSGTSNEPEFTVWYIKLTRIYSSVHQMNRSLQFGTSNEPEFTVQFIKSTGVYSPVHKMNWRLQFGTSNEQEFTELFNIKRHQVKQVENKVKKPPWKVNSIVWGINLENINFS